MDRSSSFVEFLHDGEQISGTLFTYYRKGFDRHYTFMCTYKNTNIHFSLEEYENYWAIAPLHCKIIDKLGDKVYNQYNKYLSDIHSIELKYIIVNDKVYDYFSKLISGSPKIYHVSLKMADDSILDGTDRFTELKDRQDKVKLFEQLQNQVTNYYKMKNIEPSTEVLNVEKTKEYQEIKSNINEILESIK
ncbi:hypothetical protein HLK66_04780 [Niallia circulans]|uniref:hypothetical protein n=1 Tax=Niallia circulans TaxID=1397 RepID=UPI00148FC284|nr:hypothetical protein [Niallia circulans]QJX61028.1 hypothetical protein HLK66_04780 [Niallia circulans]